MTVSKIGSTCSMIEIGNVYNSEISSKKSLIKSINIELEELSGNKLFEDNYMVMYNGTDKFEIKQFKKLGFRKVTSYKGHSSNRVQVLMWEPNKLNFFQKLREIFY